MAEGVAALLADLGYDANRINSEISDLELAIDDFDPWANRQNLAVTTACNCVQYPVMRAVLV
jgi:hypothetical protein